MKGKSVHISREKVRDFAVYVCSGTNHFLIDAYVKQFYDLLTEEEKSFDLNVVDANKQELQDIFLISRQPPILAEFRLVIVKDFHVYKNASKQLLEYAKKPVHTSVFLAVLKPSKILKTEEKYLKEIDKLDRCILYAPSEPKGKSFSNQISTILQKYALNISPEAKTILEFNLGNDLYKLDEAIHKLSTILGKNTVIQDTDIDTYIGISKVYNEFEIQSAIAIKDIKTIPIKVNGYLKHEKSPMKIIGVLYTFFLNIVRIYFVKKKNTYSTQRDITNALEMHPYVYEKNYLPAIKHYSYLDGVNALSSIRKIDAKCKGVNSKSAIKDLIVEMIYSLL